MIRRNPSIELTTYPRLRAPMLIVAKDRGKALRFFLPQQIGGRAESLRAFLQAKAWDRIPAWSGVWAPGGSR